MAKFKVGDRVRIVDKKYTHCKVGDIGTIKYIESVLTQLKYDVEFDREDELFTSCNGRTKDNRGQWVSDYNIELIEPEFKLVIISKGDKTKAKLYRGESLEKEVEVNRYHKDEYSEKAAVEAVTKKIFEKKVDWFNGKVVCVSYIVEGFTKGKIYECIEGKLTSDSGDKMGAYTIEKMKNSHLFIPIVE